MNVRVGLVIAGLWLVPPLCEPTTVADTRVDVERICPLCGTKFKARLAASGTRSGQRLDLRPVGAIASPWPLAVCSKCRFVLYKGEDKPYSDEELKSLRAIVDSDDYRMLAPDDPSYYRLAKLYEGLKRPPYEIAHVYLKASWQVEEDKDRASALLRKSLQWLDKFLASSSEEDKHWETAEFLRGELLRRLGKFEEAKKQFDRLNGLEQFERKPFPKLISQELGLIRAEDSSPQGLCTKTYPAETAYG